MTCAATVSLHRLLSVPSWEVGLTVVCGGEVPRETAEARSRTSRTGPGPSLQANHGLASIPRCLWETAHARTQPCRIVVDGDQDQPGMRVVWLTLPHLPGCLEQQPALLLHFHCFLIHLYTKGQEVRAVLIYNTEKIKSER